MTILALSRAPRPLSTREEASLGFVATVERARPTVRAAIAAGRDGLHRAGAV